MDILSISFNIGDLEGEKQNNFPRGKMNWETFINKLEVAIIELVNNGILLHLSDKSHFYHWDSIVKINRFGLKNPPFVGKGGEEVINQRDSSVWTLPKEGWSELNCDGASRGNFWCLRGRTYNSFIKWYDRS